VDFLAVLRYASGEDPRLLPALAFISLLYCQRSQRAHLSRLRRCVRKVEFSRLAFARRRNGRTRHDVLKMRLDEHHLSQGHKSEFKEIISVTFAPAIVSVNRQTVVGVGNLEYVIPDVAVLTCPSV